MTPDLNDTAHGASRTRTSTNRMRGGRDKSGNPGDQCSSRKSRKSGNSRNSKSVRPGGDHARKTIGLSGSGLGVAVATAVAILAGTALFTGFLSPPASQSPSVPASARVLLHSTASSVVVDNAAGWLTDDQRATVRKFDASSGGFEGHVLRTGGTPISIAQGYGQLWVADISKNVIYEVDPSSGKESGPAIEVAQGPVSVVAGYGGVWVASLLSGTVSLIDPRTGDIEASVALPDGAVRLALGAGYVWVTGQTDTLARIDPKPLGVTLRWRDVEVGQGPIGVAAGAGAVWVANAESGTVTRVNPRTLAVTGVIHVGSGSRSVPNSDSDPQTVAVFDGRLWVGMGSRPAVLVFDPNSGTEMGKALALPGTVRDLYASPDGLWATTANAGTVVELSAD